MIRVGLGRTRPSYEGVTPPFGPGKGYPELLPLLGDAAAAGPPNPVYAGVRAALRGLGLDAARFDTAEWNPLGGLVRRGGSVVLKPNFILHWNKLLRPDGTTESLITHGAVLRAMADYAFLAVGAEGSVTLAEAPQHDCDFSKIRDLAGLDAIVRFYEDTLRREFTVIDLRTEAVTYRDNIIVARRRLPGDPNGYRVVDLGARSFFAGSGIDPARFRGADYDPAVTTEHHANGRNEYLLSETVLSADLVVNLPKMKTHKKTGVTLALKNLVGINGDKNWLPHHSLGAEDEGGDEFPGRRFVDRMRSRLTELARPVLDRPWMQAAARAFRRAEIATRGDDFLRAGNWWGNRTCWRMCADLNRCLYYSDAGGAHLDAARPVRRVLTVMDAVVAGEGMGPLSPIDRPLGVVLAATDPIALDLAAVRLMGYDERRVPKIVESMRADDLRITDVRSADDVRIGEASAEGFEVRELGLDDLRAERPFLAHPGWQGHIERSTP